MENLGESNAFTDREMTVFHFNCYHKNFSAILDRFAHFFINPDFLPENVANEVLAVNSEFEKNLVKDYRKKSQILADLLPKTSPMSRFGSGNKKTLLGSHSPEQLVAQLKLNFSKYYNASSMKLVIYSRDEFEATEKIVKNLFGQIKQGSYKPNHPVGRALTIKGGQVVFYKQTILTNEVSIHFLLPSLQTEFYGTGALSLAKRIVENKSTDGLFDILKKKGLVNKLNASIDKNMASLSEFSINLIVTEEGKNNLSIILSTIDSFLASLPTLLNKELFDQYSSLVKTKNLLFLKNCTVSECMEGIAIHMIKHKADDYLKEEPIGEFSKDKLVKFASKIRIHEATVFIGGFALDADNLNKSVNCLSGKFRIGNEKYYSTDYLTIDLNLKQLLPQQLKPFKPVLLSQTVKSSLNFLLTLVPSVERQERILKEASPFKLKKSEGFNFVSFFGTREFVEIGESVAFVNIDFQEDNPKETQLYREMLHERLKRKINKVKGDSEILKTVINLTPTVTGLSFTVQAYGQSIFSLVNEIADKFLKSEITKEDEFKSLMIDFKSQVSKCANNQPYIRAYEVMESHFFSNILSTEEIDALTKHATREGFNQYFNNVNASLKITSFILGENTLKEETLSDKLFRTANFIKEPTFVQPDVPIKMEIVRLSLPSIGSNVNNAFVSCVPIGWYGIENLMLAKSFHLFFGNAIFTRLRTEKGFGYIAKSKIEIRQQFLFYCYHVQGSYYRAEKMEEAGKEVVNEIKAKLKLMNENDWKELKEKVIDNLQLGKNSISVYVGLISKEWAMTGKVGFDEKKIKEFGKLSLIHFKEKFSKIFESRNELNILINKNN